MTDHLFVLLTGGPGSGKSSLIAALAAAGVRHMPRQLTVFRSATSATANPLDLPKFHHAIEIAEGALCQPEPSEPGRSELS
jgi:predicted ATPase